MISIFKKTALFTTFLFICNFAGVAEAQLFGFTKIKDMSCAQLSKAAQDKDFALNSLAGIHGVKKCPDFSFDMKAISDFDRRIFAQEMQEANILLLPSPVSATAQVAIAETATIENLRSRIKKEKDPVEKMALMKQLRTKYRNNNRRADSIKILKDFHALAQKTFKKDPKNIKHQDLYLEATVNLGRQYYSENDFKKATPLLTATINSLKPFQHQNLTEIGYLFGKVKEDEQKFKEAIVQYDLVLEELKKGPSKNASLTREKLLWTRAWVLYKDEQWDQAGDAFKVLAFETLDTAEKSRAQFFLARTLVRIGKKDEALKIWAQLTQDDFYSYYSLLAYDELSLKIPSFNSLKPTEKFNFDKNLSFLTAKQKDFFNALLQHEEVDLAERTALALADKPEQLTVLGLELAHRGRRFLPLFMAFAKLPVEQKQDVMVQKYDLLFPRLYSTEVKEMASVTGLPSSLIFSIMRQESAFNMNSRSPANAYGLMQVIPPLAKSLARKHKLEYKKAEDLFNPQINIKLGSFELSAQVKKQNDQYALVAAAYNAGPGALSRWLKTRYLPQFDIVDFVEEIPYDETRLYVKVVARNHLFYDRLENPNKELSFPENFIKPTDLVNRAPSVQTN